MSYGAAFDSTKNFNDYVYESTITVYRAQNCTDCKRKPYLRRKIDTQKSKTPIEVETDFGQIKSNKHYNRFRHFSKSKVEMDFAILAIAFNIRKMFSYKARLAKNTNNKVKSANGISHF